MRVRRSDLLVIICFFGGLIMFTSLTVDKVRRSKSKYSNVTRHWLKGMVERMKSRKELIKRVCSVAQKSSRPRNPDLVVDSYRKVAFCRHGKVATSTLLYYFLLLSDRDSQTKLSLKDDIDELHVQVPEMFDKVDRFMSAKEVARDVHERKIYTFSFVRHPFERLVSAYENKILHPPRSVSGVYESLSDALEGNFTKFVDFVLDTSAGCVGMRCHQMDVHWMPFYARCAYCELNYDAIGHLETFAEDIKFIALVSGLEPLLPQGYENTDMNSVSQNQERALQYFELLDKERVGRLHELYKMDFEMFGYDAGPYLK